MNLDARNQADEGIYLGSGHTQQGSLSRLRGTCSVPGIGSSVCVPHGSMNPTPNTLRTMTTCTQPKRNEPEQTYTTRAQGGKRAASASRLEEGCVDVMCTFHDACRPDAVAEQDTTYTGINRRQRVVKQRHVSRCVCRAGQSQPRLLAACAIATCQSALCN